MATSSMPRPTISGRSGRAERAALMQVDAAAVERGASYVAPYAFNGRTYREMLRSMPRIQLIQLSGVLWSRPSQCT